MWKAYQLKEKEKYALLLETRAGSIAEGKKLLMSC
jgi:hypothetical protein